MFEKLLKQWANEQGFQTWSQDHAAVLRNLTKWLSIHAVEQGLHQTALGRGRKEGFLLGAVVVLFSIIIASGGW